MFKGNEFILTYNMKKKPTTGLTRAPRDSVQPFSHDKI